MIGIQEKEKRLRDHIEKAKTAFIAFQESRKREIGALAIKAGLLRFENQKLFSLFQKIASGKIGGDL